MRKRLAAAGLSLALLLSGCGSLWERDYTSVTTHVQQSVGEENPNVLRAESYQELVSGVLHFVSQGSASGTIRLYQYTGDVESDLAMACDEVLEEDPLGSYALRGIEQSYSRIVSYYECTFQFDYRREREEIQGVTNVSSLVALRELIQDAMDRFAPSVAVRVNGGVEEDAVEEMARSWYDQNPQLALGFPRIAVGHYPSQEAQRQIIEVRFTYPNGQEESLEQSQALVEAAQELIQDLNADQEGLLTAAARLWEGLTVEEDMGGSAYEALVNRQGDSQGIARGVSLLGGQLGVECLVTEGALDGQEHWWNTLTGEEGETLYLDLSAGEPVLLTGEQLLERSYWWEGADALAEEIAAQKAEGEPSPDPESGTEGEVSGEPAEESLEQQPPEE